MLAVEKNVDAMKLHIAKEKKYISSTPFQRIDQRKTLIQKVSLFKHDIGAFGFSRNECE